MRTRCVLILAALLSFGTIPRAHAQHESIVNSKHNLSVSGPGTVKSTNEQEVCIFCHTPHNASPIQPLWNRELPVSAYVPYSSNSLQAKPGQPTGTSKLCLSCHDGTIALGSVISHNQKILMAGGMTTLPPERPSNLGTDLSDDHPISFRYDATLVGKNPKLRSPLTLPPQTKLDSNQELQCTTCHDAHDDARGKFLVMDNSSSQLCNSCHNQGATDIANHVNCSSCHQPHTAPSGPYLLRGTTVTDTCNKCHSSVVSPTQGANIAADLEKLSRHDTAPSVALKSHVPDNIGCSDCHESHTMLGASAASAPLISPKLGNIAGINAAGSVVPKAQYQYEVCFKCHGDQYTTKPRKIPRQIVQSNTRFQFDPSAVSYHPVEAPGKGMNVPSLRPGYTTASIIYCTDCHASDTSKAATGSGPNGPHGSNVSPLLIAQYDTIDGAAETAATYALCYRCHERSNLLSNVSFTHSQHVVDQHTPCSVCHDAHGISSAQGNTVNNSALINFDVSVVQADPVTHKREFRSLGPSAGECFLSCHGVAHSPKSYPVSGGAPAGAVRPLGIKTKR
jgi:predicted CXXCH cytochrome family protein